MRSLLLLILSLLALRAEGLIAVWGDTQAHPRVQRVLARSMAAREPDLVIHTGDLSASGSQAGYDGFFDLSAPLAGIPLRPARGNHDGLEEIFTGVFGLERSYYSLAQDSLHLIFLDSNLDLLPGSAQYNWLVEELNSSPSLPSIIVIHHGPFSSGYHGGHGDLQLFLPALCAKYSVSAVLSGHDHNYERLSHAQTAYIVSGGGGGHKRPIFRPRDPRSQYFLARYHYLILERQGTLLRLSAHDLRGRVFDQVELPLHKD
ncbi:MAG: metallophosphoesterase [Candidatus Cloacimonetes bacterium]|nr:metallophosphoesterase [Candidatus Cloacimonadota bacterium]